MMKTQYIKPEIHMVLLENMLMAASNSKSWAVDYANDQTDSDGDDHGHIFGLDTWGTDPSWGSSSDPFDSDNW